MFRWFEEIKSYWVPWHSIYTVEVRGDITQWLTLLLYILHYINIHWMSNLIKMNWLFAYSNSSKQAGRYICMHTYMLAIHLLTLTVGHHDMIHSVLLMQDAQLQSVHTFIHPLTSPPTRTHTHTPSSSHVIWTCHCIGWWIESLMGSKHEVQPFPKHQHFNRTLISVYVCVGRELFYGLCNCDYVFVCACQWVGVKQMHV